MKIRELQGFNASYYLLLPNKTMGIIEDEEIVKVEVVIETVLTAHNSKCKTPIRINKAHKTKKNAFQYSETSLFLRRNQHKQRINRKITEENLMPITNLKPKRIMLFQILTLKAVIT